MQKKNLKRKKSFRYSKGITLIALVITIIVLLILAGVTISLTIGENGIFKTVQLAAKNYTNAQEKELADLAEFNNTLNDTIKGEEKIQLVTEITLNKTETTLGVGSTETLIATINPSSATNKNLTWTSSNTDVAIVSDGTVTAVAVGTATITAVAQDGSEAQGSCTITVEEPKVYLYNLGDPCISVTGGWTTKWEAGAVYGSSIWDKGTMELDTTASDKMVFKCQSIGGYTGAILTTVNKINLTNYSTLNIQYGNLYVSDAVENHRIVVSASRSGIDYFYPDKYFSTGSAMFRVDAHEMCHSKTNYSNSILSIDISEIEGEGYVAPLIMINVATGNPYYSGEVYKVWLE